MTKQKKKKTEGNMIKRTHFRASFLVPSIITLAGTSSALSGIRFAISEDWKLSVFCIILAGIFDGLDGRAARLLKAVSSFGEILDSLSDFAAFGVAPAFIIYYWSLDDLAGLGWAVSLFFTICCALRLARFNTMVVEEETEFSDKYFQGVPAPMGALIALFPLILSFIGIDIRPEIVLVWIVVISILMVSVLPIYSFKKSKIPAKLLLPLLALVGLGLTGIAGRPWHTLSVIIVGYLIMIPISYINYKKN